MAPLSVRAAPALMPLFSVTVAPALMIGCGVAPSVMARLVVTPRVSFKMPPSMVMPLLLLPSWLSALKASVPPQISTPPVKVLLVAL
jgi:hypothetical protein